MEAVKHAIMLVDAALVPANPCVVAVEVERTLALFGAPENWGDIADFYLEAFEDVPLDLVQVALKHARKSLKFFPRPAELLAPIRGELEERRHAARRLRVAADRARRAERVDDPPLIDEERKAAVRAALEAAGIKHMPDVRAESQSPMEGNR